MSGKRRKMANGSAANGHEVQKPTDSNGVKTHADSTASINVSSAPFVDAGSITFVNIRERYPVYDTAKASNHTVCSEQCRFEESTSTLQMYSRVVHSPLVIPLLFGFDRQIKSSTRAGIVKSSVLYVTPCGRAITNMASIDAYLITVKSVIPITCFSFETDLNISRRFVIQRSMIQAAKVITNDSTPYEIPAFNCYAKNIPVGPDGFVYVTKSIPSEAAGKQMDAEQVKKRTEWCACKSVCSNSANNGEGDCLCLSILDEQTSGYEYGLLTEPQKYVVECSDRCSCSPLCRNRVSTNSIPWRVMLYFYPGKQWGVRSTCDIPKGAFLGLYIGQLLTEAEIGRGDRPDTYFFTLKNLDEGDLLHQSTNGNNDSRITAPTDSTLDPYEKLYSLDAKKFGNYTRFFNHSCDPNCFAQAIFREHCGPLVYQMGFFTKKNIVAGDELTWDYNYTIGSVANRRIDCCCGSENCRGRLL